MSQPFNTEGNLYPSNENIVELGRLEAALFTSFGPDTLRQDQETPWDPADPANNQCAVAALVVNRLLPQFDQIVNDNRPDVDHYWGKNSTTGEEIDLTRCQRRLRGIIPHTRRVRIALDLLTGDRALQANTPVRFEILLARTVESLKKF